MRAETTAGRNVVERDLVRPPARRPAANFPKGNPVRRLKSSQEQRCVSDERPLK